MTAKRPYLLRALYEWIVDNELTPHLVVDAEVPYCEVPQQFVQDGQIILNVSPTAVGNLLMSNTDVSFHARFSGKEHKVYIPIAAVIAIYARENGAGTIFEEEAELAEADAPTAEHTGQDTKPSMSLVDEPSEGSEKPAQKTSKSGNKAGSKGKASHLKVIK
ncbi:ClpXP protease specificity-enhancing factor [Thalassospira xiamenensis]|nr:ClpXP protease specificity-enhancing factor [Thalassospira xiamenensis]